MGLRQSSEPTASSTTGPCSPGGAPLSVFVTCMFVCMGVYASIRVYWSTYACALYAFATCFVHIQTFLPSCCCLCAVHVGMHLRVHSQRTHLHRAVWLYARISMVPITLVRTHCAAVGGGQAMGVGR